MDASSAVDIVQSVDFSPISDMAQSLGAKAVVPIIAVLTIAITVKLIKKFGNKIG